MIRTMRVYYSTRTVHWDKPVIHLENRFLAENGFGIGDIIEVDYNPRRIVIHKVADASTGGITPSIPNL